MTLPKKQGIRRIEVGGMLYYWTVKADYHEQKIKIRIGKVDEPNKNILVEAYFVDGWLKLGGNEVRRNEIDVVTPGFVREAIDFALNNGWRSIRQSLNIEYKNGLFSTYNND